VAISHQRQQSIEIENVGRVIFTPLIETLAVSLNIVKKENFSSLN